MAEFGGGIGLADNFDLAINTAGDIRTVTGTDELEKDIAFFVAIELHEELGSPINSMTLARARTRTRDVILDDPRINSIISIEANAIDDNYNRIEIISEVIADTGQQELVISLGE